MQFGSEVPTFGIDRLYIVEWLTELLIIHEDDLCKRLGELGIPKLLLELVGVYHTNTIFHEITLRMFRDALTSTLDPFMLTV
jgi:hypothetical protein